MSESVVIVAPLAGADAVAVRCGDDVLIQLSPTVPEWAHHVVIDDLRRAVNLGSVSVSLPVGRAVLVAARPTVSRPAGGVRADGDRAMMGPALRGVGRGIRPEGRQTSAGSSAVAVVAPGVAPFFVSPDALHSLEEPLPALICDHWAPDNYGLDLPLQLDASDHALDWSAEMI